MRYLKGLFFGQFWALIEGRGGCQLSAETSHISDSSEKGLPLNRFDSA